MRINSIFTSSKLSVCQLLTIIFQFVSKAKCNSTINLCNVDAKTIADWNVYLRNVCTRMLLKFCIKLGGRNKGVQVDETHFFSVPKHHRGKHRKLRNWLLVIVEKDSTKMFCQLVRKRTRPALETIINECVLPGTLIESDEHKSYFWLGKTTNNRTYRPCRPALYTHSTVCHKDGFKAADGTHTNKVEGCNSLLKGPYKSMKGLPKHLIPSYLDQIMFECFANSVLEFSITSHSQSEKDKSFNILLFFVTALGELHCGDNFEWLFEQNAVSDGSKIEIKEDLYDYYKDQGYSKNGNDVPFDDITDIDENMDSADDFEYDSEDFHSEKDDSEDSDF